MKLTVIKKKCRLTDLNQELDEFTAAHDLTIIKFLITWSTSATIKGIKNLGILAKSSTKLTT